MKVLLASLVIGLLALAFVGALVFWARWSRGQSANAVQVVAKNSGFLLLSQFTNKGLDFLFALYMLRALGPIGNGQYQYAILIWLYLKTVTDFGLGVLATQQIAHAPERAGALLGQTTLLRLVLLAISLPQTRSGAALARCKSARSPCSRSRSCRPPTRTPRRASSTGASSSRSRRR